MGSPGRSHALVLPDRVRPPGIRGGPRGSGRIGGRVGAVTG
jgi:hypothetical protein